VNCYLHAAASEDKKKSKKLLARVLWLLSAEDPQGLIVKAFENSADLVSAWSWIVYIPQLLSSLARPESKQVVPILGKIAQTFPQALYYSLRTTLLELRERLQYRQQGNNPPIPRPSGQGPGQPQGEGDQPQSIGQPQGQGQPPQGQSQPQGQPQNQGQPQGQPPQGQSQPPQGQPQPTGQPQGQNQPQPQSQPPQGQPPTAGQAPPSTQAMSQEGDGAQSTQTAGQGQGPGNMQLQQLQMQQQMQIQGGPGMMNQDNFARQAMMNQRQPMPLQFIVDVMSKLKMAHPLLVHSMESMIEEIISKFKPLTEEELYRIIQTLLYESYQQSNSRYIDGSSNHEQIPQSIEINLQKISKSFLSVNPVNSKFKASFDQDFIVNKPTFSQVVENLRLWRDRLHLAIDKFPRVMNLENLSRYLVELQKQKYDDIEIPGQYLWNREATENKDFVKIERFLPNVDISRKHGTSYRRFTVRGENGILYPFIVQHAASRNARTEERILQLFRLLNGVLEKRRETRRRNLFFHTPAMIPLSPHARIVQDDPTYASLEDIYDEHCAKKGFHFDEPITYFRENLKAFSQRSIPPNKDKRLEYLTFRVNVFEDISKKMIPNSIFTEYMAKSMSTPTDLWMFKKQFTYQLACVTFMTYSLFIGHRAPHKLNFAKNTGNIFATELQPIFNQNGILDSPEAVPFRLSPNMQHFLTEDGIEGGFANSLMIIARCITEPEFQILDFFSIFVRDELLSWLNVQRSFQNQPIIQTPQEIRDRVAHNVDLIHARIKNLACAAPNPNLLNKQNPSPVNHQIQKLITAATDPQQLSQMDPTWHPWL